MAALTFSHVQQRDGRWCIVDLRGKHGRIRTVPMPAWVNVAIDAWTAAAGIIEGRVFRSVNRADRVAGDHLGEKVVWQMFREYAEAAGTPGIAPHDARRTCAKLCRAAGGEFAYFGGVPRTILYDNTRIAVKEIGGDGQREPTEADHFLRAARREDLEDDLSPNRRKWFLHWEELRFLHDPLAEIFG